MADATPSEKSFLLSEGYTIARKLGQGSYSKVLSKQPNLIMEVAELKVAI